MPVQAHSSRAAAAHRVRVRRRPTDHWQRHLQSQRRHFNVSGGDAVIGDAAPALRAQRRQGDRQLAGGLNVGGQSGGTGTYLLSAGKLTVGSAGNGDAVIGDGPGGRSADGGTAVFSAGLTVASLFAGSGNFTVSGGTDTISGDTVIADAGVGAYAQSGGRRPSTASSRSPTTSPPAAPLHSPEAAPSSRARSMSASARHERRIRFQRRRRQRHFAGANTSGPNFKIGIGGTGTLNDGGGKLKAANVAIGTENGDSGLVNIPAPARPSR